MDRNLFGEPGLQVGRVSKRLAQQPRPSLRRCLYCNEPFVHIKGKNGTKYCSPLHARRAQNRQTKGWTADQADRIICLGCGVPANGNGSRMLDVGPVCGKCWAKLVSVWLAFRRHHVPAEKVSAFLANPSCAACGVDLLTPQKTVRGEWKVPLVIDHSHACCPGRWSCGSCVRAFLCNRCNLIIGHAGEDVIVLQGIIEVVTGFTKTEG